VYACVCVCVCGGGYAQPAQYLKWITLKHNCRAEKYKIININFYTANMTVVMLHRYNLHHGSQ
jgi:hypothetical protein